MNLDELLFVKRMVDSKTEVSRDTWHRVLAYAVEMEKRFSTTPCTCAPATPPAPRPSRRSVR